MHLIKRTELLKRVPLSDRTIYNMEKAGTFPKRIVLSARAVAWDLDEITKWVDARKASEDKPTRPGVDVEVV